MNKALTELAGEVTNKQYAIGVYFGCDWLQVNQASKYMNYLYTVIIIIICVKN